MLMVTRHCKRANTECRHSGARHLAKVLHCSRKELMWHQIPSKSSYSVRGLGAAAQAWQPVSNSWSPFKLEERNQFHKVVLLTSNPTQHGCTH